MANDFIPNRLSFDVAGCMALIKNIYGLYLDDLSAKLVEIVQYEIMKNGNGSKIMRLSAASEVKETRREITDEMIILEAGIDLDALKGSEPIFVRVSVVLHGNQAGGPLKSKPGQDTWTKHVGYKRLSPAKTVFDLPDGFNQDDVSEQIETEVSKQISENASKQIDKYAKTFADNVRQALNAIDWSAFVKVS